MGRYNDELKRLQSQRRAFANLHNSTMQRWQHLMSDEAKVYNTTHFNITDRYYERQISAIEDKAREEMIREATEEVLKRVEVQITDEATPKLKDLRKQIETMFK